MRYPAHGLLVRQAANLISFSVIRQRAMANWAPIRVGDDTAKWITVTRPLSVLLLMRPIAVGFFCWPERRGGGAQDRAPERPRLFCRPYKKRLSPPIDQFPINLGYDQQCGRAECR